MTMNWEEDVSEETRDDLLQMGNYSPTFLESERSIKGTLLCGYGVTISDYLSSDDLRKRAAACIEAADWLDKRAQQCQMKLA